MHLLAAQYAFNLFSHNSKMDVEVGYNEEELKLMNETRKIWCVSVYCKTIRHAMSQVTFWCKFYQAGNTGRSSSLMVVKRVTS